MCRNPGGKPGKPGGGGKPFERPEGENWVRRRSNQLNLRWSSRIVLRATDTNGIHWMEWRLNGIHFHFHLQVRNRIPMEIRCKGVPKFNCTFLFDTDEYCDQVLANSYHSSSPNLSVTKNPCYRGIICLSIFIIEIVIDNSDYWQVINMKATQCNHRKDVNKCPITLNTKVIIIKIINIVANAMSLKLITNINFQLGCELKTTITNKGAKILVSPKIDISGGCLTIWQHSDITICGSGFEHFSSRWRHTTCRFHG